MKLHFFYIISFVFLCNAIVALFFVEYWLTIPIESIIEVVFFVYALFVFQMSVKSIKYLLLAFLTMAYILVSFIYAVLFDGANLLDFLMIYKAFIYLFVLLLISKKKIIEFDHLTRFYSVLIFLFLFKYLFLQILSLSDRPTLFVENNFELMFLYALYILIYDRQGIFKLKDISLLGLITILSLSRSSIVIFIALMGYLYVRTMPLKKLIILMPLIIVLGVGVIVLVFAGRSESSIEEIDRYKFFLVFLDNVKDWEVIDFFVGADRISPLSVQSCETLSFYKNLFSFEKDGTCYSVILHSYILRAIYDHGLFGLLFIALIWYLILKDSGIKVDLSILFVFLMLLNGISVSSFNNIFAVLGMAIMLTTKDIENKGLNEIEKHVN